MMHFQKKKMGESSKRDLSMLRTSSHFHSTLCDRYLHQGQTVKLATLASDHQLQRKQTAGTVTAESQSAAWGRKAATFDLQRTEDSNTQMIKGDWT